MVELFFLHNKCFTFCELYMHVPVPPLHIPICPNPGPLPGVTFVNANVFLLRAHYESVFDFSFDFVGLQEIRLTQAGQPCMQQLARESGSDCFWGFPLSSPTGGIWGAPQGGGWDSSAEGAGYAEVDASDDPLQQKLWHSGRWLHVIVCLGEVREHINIQVVYGIAGNTALNCVFWEAVICYSSGLGNTCLIALTDANFNFDKPNLIPPALVALADGWLMDIDLEHARLHDTPPISAYTRGEGTTTCIDAMLVDPARAGFVTAMEEVPKHGLRGDNVVRYTLNISAPMQRVMKLCKLPLFSLPPRDDTNLEETCTELLRPHIPQWDSLLDTRASVDRLWEFWTWLAEETGLALSCDGLTTDTAKHIPYAPYAIERGRGTSDMLMEATLCPT